MTILVLLQKDLRIRDNPALYHAVETEQPIIVCHVMEQRLGSASKWWLSKSLEKFQQQLQTFGIPLFHLPDSNQFIEFINYINEYLPTELVDTVYSNGLDCDLPKSWEKIRHKIFMSNLIFSQEDLDREFKVFTPFWKNIRAKCSPIEPLPDPNFSDKNRIDSNIEFDKFIKFPLTSDNDCNLEKYWKVGEIAAQKRYRYFVENLLHSYCTGRDYFGVDGTSKLSPHLRFGEISVRQIYHELITSKKKVKNSEEKFCAELGWREFAYHILKHHPDMSTVPLNAKFKDHWPKYENAHLEAWKNGQTGYPWIDAAMRDLSETGWMHNRLRMLVASFLTKNLMIPWQVGEQYFYDCLVDADPASNPFGWQWVMGCGADAVPYFRIFNPMVQGEKYDPEWKYVRKWIPEFKNIQVSSFKVEDFLKKSELRPKNYPKPIIDWKQSREKALEILKSYVKAKVVSNVKKVKLS